MAVPSRIERIDGEMATVEVYGQRRAVNLLLLTDTVEVGDYVLVKHGSFAYERLEPQAAREALALFDEVFAQAGDQALRAWG